jgi:hypothetical protein
MAKPKAIGFQWKKMPTPYHGKAYRVWGEVAEEGKIKRKKFWFATEKEAKAVCADRNQEQAAYGSKVNLDSEARLEAFRASELLKGSGQRSSTLCAFIWRIKNKSPHRVPFPN